MTKNCYVQVKSAATEEEAGKEEAAKGEKKYKCLVVKETGEPSDETVTLRKAEVTKFIFVNLNINNTSHYKAEDAAAVTTSDIQVKVNIDDKVSKLLKYSSFSGGPGDGLLSTVGKVIEKPDDVTFHKLMV